ncbi:MAG TPA: HRDC domain-containing protein, partial [Longimicrobium sp.]|nr:HRDC domain-containing protein [Longimicrobium sp.]
MAQRRGREIMEALRRGLAVPEEELPRWPRSPRFERDLELEARVESLRDARTRAAEQLGLDPGFLIPRATLEEIGKARPTTPEELAQVPGVRRWQVEAVGDTILGVLRKK